MSRLLIHDYPLMVSPRLAVAIGLNEAIVLQQLHYWLGTAGKERDGKRWIYNTQVEWQTQFPFWSLNTVRRALEALEGRHLIETTDRYNVIKTDRTKWYTINYPAVEALDLPSAQDGNRVTQFGNRVTQNGQLLGVTQNGQLLPERETSTETSNKDGAEPRRAGQPPTPSEPDTHLPPVRKPSQAEPKVGKPSKATSSEKVPGGAAAARAEDMPLPGTLTALPGFAEAWAEWLAYRRARRLTTAPATLSRQLKMLEGQPDPVAVIEQTITQGWAGLFPLKGAAAARPQTQADANDRFKARMDETRQAVSGVFDD